MFRQPCQWGATVVTPGPAAGHRRFFGRNLGDSGKMASETGNRHRAPSENLTMRLDPREAIKNLGHARAVSSGFVFETLILFTLFPELARRTCPALPH